MINDFVLLTVLMCDMSLACFIFYHAFFKGVKPNKQRVGSNILGWPVIIAMVVVFLKVFCFSPVKRRESNELRKAAAVVVEEESRYTWFGMPCIE